MIKYRMKYRAQYCVSVYCLSSGLRSLFSNSLAFFRLFVTHFTLVSFKNSLHLECNN